jgi:hypothetical protein
MGCFYTHIIGRFSPSVNRYFPAFYGPFRKNAMSGAIFLFWAQIFCIKDNQNSFYDGSVRRRPLLSPAGRRMYSMFSAISSMSPEEAKPAAWRMAFLWQRRRRSVGLDDRLADTHQGGSPHLAESNSFLKWEMPSLTTVPQLGDQVLLEHALELPGQEAAGASMVLRKMFAGVTVRHNDVYLAVDRSRASTLPTKRMRPASPPPSGG